MAQGSTSVDKAKRAATQGARQAERQAKQAAENPWVERLARFGYLVRGVIYVIIGILALQIAMGAGGAAKDQKGAIEMIGSQPYGYFLLILVAIGLAGYSMWGFIRAILDPLHRGSDGKGLLARLGFLVSGISYGALLIPTIQYLTGRGQGSSAGGPQDWTVKLLQTPFGQPLVILAGLVGIAVGLGQMYVGYKEDFKRDYSLGKMSPEERRWFIDFGRFGIMARGVIFGLVGIYMLQAGIRLDPSKAKGFDGALLQLAQQPYGMVLLGIVALGLVAFGLYSVIAARYVRVNQAKSARA